MAREKRPAARKPRYVLPGVDTQQDMQRIRGPKLLLESYLEAHGVAWIFVTGLLPQGSYPGEACKAGQGMQVRAVSKKSHKTPSHCAYMVIDPVCMPVSLGRGWLLRV